MIDEGKQAALYDGASNIDVAECTKYLNIVKEIRIYIEHFNFIDKIYHPYRVFRLKDV